MSSTAKKYWPILVLIAFVGVGCSKSRGGGDMVFDSEVGHGKAWIREHGPSTISGEGNCEQCHGSDLRGGASLISCYTPSLNGETCHGDGPGIGHSPGWADPSLHGKHAKTSGMADCQACHGTDFNGGVAKVSCNSCHGSSAPHSRAPWRGGSQSHTSTTQANAPVCAQCHRTGAGGAPGCFNNTLCHGDASSHPGGWRSSHKDTSQSKASECSKCHQSKGGTPGCFNNTLCHGEKSDHPGGWRNDHKGTAQSKAGNCAACHRSSGGDAGCFNGTLCHGGSTGGGGTGGGGSGGGSQHPADWRTVSHKATASNRASECASCHTSDNSLPPDCFNGSLCHGSTGTGGGGGDTGGGGGSTGGGSPHAKGWKGDHDNTSTSKAGDCAACHRSSSGTAGCFNNTLCHGNK